MSKTEKQLFAMYIIACGTTGLFAGLWWAAEKRVKLERETHNRAIGLCKRAYQRALKRLPTRDLIGLIAQQQEDIEFEDIVKDF